MRFPGKVRPGRFAGGTQSDPLTDASSRTCRGSRGSAAPVPPGRKTRIPNMRKRVNETCIDNIGDQRGGKSANATVPSAAMLMITVQTIAKYLTNQLLAYFPIRFRSLVNRIR